MGTVTTHAYRGFAMMLSPFEDAPGYYLEFTPTTPQARAIVPSRVALRRGNRIADIDEVSRREFAGIERLIDRWYIGASRKR